MKLFHTTPEKIKKIHDNGLFGDCLFFSEEIYYMTAREAYVYEIEVDENDFVESWRLDTIEHITAIAAYCDVEMETAEDYLNDKSYPRDADKNCFVQQMMGESARADGFLGAKSYDEQGVVYIIPMTGREYMLELVI